MMTEKELKTFQCEKCPHKTKYRHNLELHVKAVHENIRDHTCKICGNSFRDKRGLINHENAVHKKIRVYICQKCPYKASQKGQLDRHVRAYHDGIRRFACSLCSYKAYHKCTLDAHVKSVHNKIKEQCQLCDFSASDADLRRHIKKQHLQMKYCCENKFCRYVGTTREKLENHMNSCRKEIGNKAFKCMECDGGKFFS